MNRQRRDSAVAAGLFLVAVTLAVPFRSQIPYHWDSAEFAVAVTHYDVRLSQPHAPGYFLYVMLGRVVNLFVGDPHASLVWISVFAGGGLAATMFLLGRAMFDQRTGVIAGLLPMTSPLVWFHGCVALTYALDAFLVCVLVLVCWRAMQRGGSWGDAVLIGALLAVAGGVRQQSVPAIGPAVLYTFWRFERQRLAKLAVAAATAVVLGLAWFLPMVAMSGGLMSYLRVVRLHSVFNAPSTLGGGGFDALFWNIFFVGLYIVNGSMLATVVLLVALLYRAHWMDAERKRRWNRDHTRAVQLLAFWVGPMMLLWMVGVTRQPGHVLSYLPGLLLLAAAALANARVAITVTVCAFNIFAFLAWPQGWDSVFHGTARTAREIRYRDRDLRTTATAIRARFNPAESVICHAGEYLYFGLRQLELLLPEFDQYQLRLDPAMLTPPGEPMMAVRDGRLRFVHGVDATGKQVGLLIVPPGLSLEVFAPYLDTSDAQPLPDTSGLVFVLPAEKLRGVVGK